MIAVCWAEKQLEISAINKATEWRYNVKGRQEENVDKNETVEKEKRNDQKIKGNKKKERSKEEREREQRDERL